MPSTRIFWPDALVHRAVPDHGHLIGWCRDNQHDSSAVDVVVAGIVDSMSKEELVLALSGLANPAMLGRIGFPTSQPHILGTWARDASTLEPTPLVPPQQNRMTRQRTSTRSNTSRTPISRTLRNDGDKQGSAGIKSERMGSDAQEIWIEAHPSASETLTRGSAYTLPVLSINQGPNPSHPHTAEAANPELVVLYPHPAGGCSFMQLPAPPSKQNTSVLSHKVGSELNCGAAGGGSSDEALPTSPTHPNGAQQQESEVSGGLSWAVHHVNEAAGLMSALSGSASSCERTAKVRGWRVAASLLSGALQDARVLPESDRGGSSEPRGLLRQCTSVLLSNSALAKEVNARIHGLCDLRPSYRTADISAANYQERDSPQEGPASTRNQSKDLQSRNTAVAGVVSQTLGLIAGAYLWRYRVAAPVGLKGLGNALVTWVAWLITWLMGAPAGLKLHEELSGLLGHAALWALHSSAAVYSASAAFLLVPLLGVVALVSALMGATGGLALSADVMVIGSLPLTLSHVAITSLLQWQMLAMRAMWMLLRGHTPPRRPFEWHRSSRRSVKLSTDGARSSRSGPGGRGQMSHSEAVEAAAAAGAAEGKRGLADRVPSPRIRSTADGLVLEQLIVGVLLFTPLLFLLPTTLIFFIAISLLRGGLNLIMGTIHAVRVGLRLAPVYALVLRLWQPAAFPVGVHFEVLASYSKELEVESGKTSVLTETSATGWPLRNEACQMTTYVRLKGVPCSVGSLILPCLWQMFHASGLLFRYNSNAM